jgi:hypothetical protein
MTDVLHRERTGRATALTVRLQVVSTNSGRPRHGRSVRLWHCDPNQVDPDQVEVRISDEAGWTEFDGLVPPAGHLHFEIHGQAGKLTLPRAANAGCALSRTEATAYGVGDSLVMASMTGDARRGLVATRTIPVP